MSSQPSPSDWHFLIERRGWVWWMPIVLVLLVLVADVAVQGREPVSFLLTGVPPLVCATRGPRATAWSVVGCLGLQMLMAAGRPGHFGEQHHLALYTATLCVGAVSVLLAHQRQRTENHLTQADTVAEAMQRALLRPVPPALAHVRAAGYYAAGEGGTLVGGDLYDMCETPFGVRALIGDVRGKGLDAVQTVAAVLGSFRVSAHEWQDLPVLADRLELSIARNSPGAGAGDPELFVTALVMEFAEDRVRVVDRGHPPPVVVGPHGARRLETAPALPLGLGDLSPGRVAMTEHTLLPGEVLVVYTDGFSEARNTDGTFYPVLRRLGEHFSRMPPCPRQVVSFLRADTEAWSAGCEADDQAVLAIELIRPTPGPTTPTSSSPVPTDLAH
ncbi:PP2C family protein-serine/threonine phosphatase [Streptomyces sp. NPDC004667]|uniref:PP2C family protein-serine/threonine phosphatase n=1 Tax=Streptomyces sp. NPDC004667 TaxID=3154285 RepID=UPI0033B20369